VSPLRFRPEGLRVPWQAIAGFAAALYVLRSALRGWDFRPDLLDAVVFGGLALLLIARALVARLKEDDVDTPEEEEPDRGDER
jgi:hypothetical protein